MKTRKLKEIFFICFCFFFVLSSTVIHANEQDLELCLQSEKIYLDQGIFTKVRCDRIDHTPKCRRCYGCYVYDCYMRCCHEKW